MATKLNKALESYIKLLREYYSTKIVKAVLFGSAARGNFGKESDADILIVTTDSNAKLKDEISMAAYEVMLKSDVILSPLVMDKKTFDWYKNNRDPLYNNINRDGIELWTKGQKSLSKSV